MSVTPPATSTTPTDKGRVTVSPEGYFIYKGQKYSLFQLIQKVLVEHAQVISKSVAGELEVMNDMTQNYKICSEIKEAIQAIRPQTSDGTVPYESIEAVAKKFAAEYPNELKTVQQHANGSYSTNYGEVWRTFGVSDIASYDSHKAENRDGANWTQQKVDQLIEGLRSHLSSVGQDQDSQKVRLQRGLHAQDETWNLLSATEKTITQNTDQIIQRV